VFQATLITVILLVWWKENQKRCSAYLQDHNVLWSKILL